MVEGRRKCKSGKRINAESSEDTENAEKEVIED